MNPLDKPCPQCRAVAGQKCRNYRGKGKQTCKERLGDLEQHAQAGKRAVARATRANAAEAEKYPLFAQAGIVEDHTPQEMYRRWRRNVAEAAERLGVILGGRILDELHTHKIRRHARGLLGEEAFATLDAHCARVYQSRDYWYGFWKRVLCGERVEMAWEPIKDRKPGEPAVRCTDWYEQRHMTPEQFYVRFPFDRFNDAPPECALSLSLTGVLD